MAILSKGMTGAPVKKLQNSLGVTEDGIFGVGTEDALKAWQAANGLSADGVAGPDTFMAMGIYELVMLNPGDMGSSVRALQTKLGTVTVDGIYGPETEQAVRDFQKTNNLVVDGIAGPITLCKMKTFAEITKDTVKASMRSIWDTLTTLVYGPIPGSQLPKR